MGEPSLPETHNLLLAHLTTQKPMIFFVQDFFSLCRSLTFLKEIFEGF